MSSRYVRNTILTYLTNNWTATPVYDLSNFLDKTNLNLANLNMWVGVQFLHSEETYAGVGGKCFRESGTIIFHVAHAVGQSSDGAINACESIRDLFRGMRIGGNIVIESVDPPTDMWGEAIEFDGNWHGFAIYTEYYMDFDTV